MVAYLYTEGIQLTAAHSDGRYSDLIQEDLYLLAQLFRWDVKPRSILATYAFNLIGIKRSWHSTAGGSVVLGLERVTVTNVNRYPICKA